MHAIILGAGEGTRMWPISTLMNKHLLKLGGKPVIRHIVDKLFDSGWFDKEKEEEKEHANAEGGISIICLEKDAKDYEWEFRDMADVQLYVITHNTGTAHEFYNAMLEKTTLHQDEFLLHYGDTITDLDYSLLIRAWNQSAHKAMIAVTQNIRHDYSQVYVDEKTNYVIRMEEKPKLVKPSWTGIGIFNADYFIDIYNKVDVPKEVYLDFGYHVLPQMVKDGGLYAYEYNGRWFDVGNLRSYQKLYAEYQNKDLNL